MVNVNTNRPFSGRIYALGRSETCNVDVINSDAFRLDLTMGGQDCNTQSAVSERQRKKRKKETDRDRRRRKGGKTERQNDSKTERQRDKETEGQVDRRLMH